MKLTRTPTTAKVTFSATEVASAGGPNRGAYILYRNGLLDDWSHNLDKASYLSPLIDRLVALADAALAAHVSQPTLH